MDQLYDSLLYGAYFSQPARNFPAVMDSALVRLIGAVLVVVGALLKLVLKTRRPPIGQIIMSCLWIGVSLLVIGYIWMAVGEM